MHASYKMSSKLPVQARVAVIGAGVSGLVATKYVEASGACTPLGRTDQTNRRLAQEGFNVTLYERHKHIGWLWNFSKQPEHAGNSEGRFASAVYADLATNFPRQLMELQDHRLENQPLFMSHDRVLEYLKDYSKTFPSDSLRLRTDKEVVDLYYEKSRTEPEGGVWQLTSRDISTGSKLTREYDAVVVAVGMFDKPYILDYKGLEQWKTRWPETLSHAKTYRSPKPFIDKVSQSTTKSSTTRETDASPRKS